MAVNEWWRGDPAERFWMEVTNREVLGENLLAPQVDDAGREYWSYKLVDLVREGDFVLHWHKDLLREPALVGWSRVAGAPYEATIEWQSRGTYGRRRPASRDEPAWLAPLTGYRDAEEPLTQTRIRAHEADLRSARDRLGRTYPGPVYFPFALSGKRPPRAAQGYLVKFPRELLRVFSELTYLRSLAEGRVDEGEPGTTAAGGRGDHRRRGSVVGDARLADAEVRVAIEDHAVELVMTRYREAGWDVENVGDRKSWDVEAHRGPEVLHIEVKGSSGVRDAVELTYNEVRHAEDFAATVLVVVDEIRWRRENGKVTTAGGRWRRWPVWTPDRSALAPTRYRYVLPPDGAEDETPL